MCDVTFVFKAINDITLEIKFDNGTVMYLDKSEEDFIIRNWKRKYEDVCIVFHCSSTSLFRTYRIVVNERVSITDVSIRYVENLDATIKLGYLSVRQSSEFYLKNNVSL